MATFNSFQNVTEPSGGFYPQDYVLNTLEFITSTKSKLDLKKLVAELCYFEDVYSPTTSGYVTLTDAQGMIELLQITGNEYINIDFGKVKGAPTEMGVAKTFRVYKIANRTPTGNMNTEFYTLYFCSDELILSQQTKITKSYKGQKISSIINSILTEKLKVPNNRIEKIEETTGINDFIVPRAAPFEAISWLSIYARPQQFGTTGGADMLLFETKNGFNFRSLQSLYKDNVYATYKYQAKNAGDPNNTEEKIITVLDYEIIKSFDMAEAISSGVFANRLISLDPLTRTKRVTDFDYSKYKQNATSLNKGETSAETPNRFGKLQAQSYNSVVKMATSNANQNDVQYIKDNEGASKDIYIENYVPNRTAQIGLANYTVLKIIIPGDSGITAGKTINFNLYGLKPTSGIRELDKFYSGKYLVSAVRHVIISPNKYQTVLEIAKDSTANEYY